MTRNSKTKTKISYSTGSRQEAAESVVGLDNRFWNTLFPVPVSKILQKLQTLSTGCVFRERASNLSECSKTDSLTLPSVLIIVFF